MTLKRAWSPFSLALSLIAAVALLGCTPEGCTNSVAGNDNVIHSACGGSGDAARAAVTTPAPVVVPPTVITPVIVPEPAP